MHDFKDLITDLIMVLPDGSSLPTKKNKIGPGLDFSGLFIGGKSSFGNLKY